MQPIYAHIKARDYSVLCLIQPQQCPVWKQISPRGRDMCFSDRCVPPGAFTMEGEGEEEGEGRTRASRRPLLSQTRVFHQLRLASTSPNKTPRVEKLHRMCFVATECLTEQHRIITIRSALRASLNLGHKI